MMRSRLSTLSAFVAGVFTALAGVYLTQTSHTTPTQPTLVQAGFSPGSLLVNADMKGETWDAF